MASATIRRRRRSVRDTPPRITMEYVDINSLAPYEFNPRDNAAAIESVANSIRSFGFLVPVVVDKDNVLVAGHTRIEAAKTMGLAEVPCVRAEYLTPDQADAFRIIDNKVAELARWDFDLLSTEISRLQGSGLVFTDYGFTQEEIDCLSDVVADDCLSVDSLIDSDARERIRRAERRAPSTSRFVLGEIVFFIQASDYRRWIDSIRAEFDFNETAIIAEIKRRLGITEEAVEAAQRVRSRIRSQ